VTLHGSGANGAYSGSYSFVEQGAYRVVVYAQDSTGQAARPRQATVTGAQWHQVYLPVVVRSH
jgi:hypothetical protein